MQRILTTLVLLLPLCVLPAACSTTQRAPEPAAVPDTTVLIVRHAEKAADPARDPKLNDAGTARARALADALRLSPPDALYASQFKRTINTLQPLADAVGGEVQVIPIERSVEAYIATLASRIRDQHAGDVVVIASHSNIVPELVAELSGHAVAPLDESAYGDLFIVQLSSSRPARVIHTRFGD